MRLRFCLSALAVLLWLPGCGGGGGGGSTSQTVPVQVSIGWGARSRVINSPASALSATITLTGANPAGGDFSFTVNRSSAAAAYIGSYTSSSSAKVGSWPLAVRFYAQAGGQDAVVGIAQATVALQPDGSGIGDVSTTKTVASVAVSTGQTVGVGQTKDLSFTAKDANGSVVAVTPGSVLLAVTSGANRLQATTGPGVTGLLPGTASVTATVDGVVSPTQAVGVTSDTVVAITPPTPSLPINGAQQFTATVTGSTVGANTGVTWSVFELTAGGSISSGGLYTAPPDRGTYHIIATSVYDPNKSATVPVVVQSGSVGGTIQ